jgi:hypothetical protein
MRSNQQSVLWIAVLSAALLLLPGSSLAQATSSKPRVLVLPWLVIDRSTNQDASRLAPSSPRVSAEARRLASSAQAALDAVMHRHRMMTMIPRREWEPHWKQLQPKPVVRQGPGCAVCTPVGELLRYDRAALRRLARAVRADYVWLGVTVVPLTPQSRDTRPDDCCREALAQEREAVLARSSALLVRASDGEATWQRDARRLDRDVPRRTRHSVYTLQRRREFAVRHTARALGSAFGREHREALK